MFRELQDNQDNIFRPFGPPAPIARSPYELIRIKTIPADIIGRLSRNDLLFNCHQYGALNFDEQASKAQGKLIGRKRFDKPPAEEFLEPVAGPMYRGQLLEEGGSPYRWETKGDKGSYCNFAFLPGVFRGNSSKTINGKRVTTSITACISYAVVYSSFEPRGPGNGSIGSEKDTLLPFDPVWRTITLGADRTASGYSTGPGYQVKVDGRFAGADNSNTLAIVSALNNSFAMPGCYISFVPIVPDNVLFSTDHRYGNIFQDSANYRMKGASLGAATFLAVKGNAQIHSTGYSKYVTNDMQLMPRFTFKEAVADKGGDPLYPDGNVKIGGSVTSYPSAGEPPLVRATKQLNFVEDVQDVMLKVLYCAKNNYPLIIPAKSSMDTDLRQYILDKGKSEDAMLWLPVLQQIYTMSMATDGFPIINQETGVIRSICMGSTITEFTALSGLICGAQYAKGNTKEWMSGAYKNSIPMSAIADQWADNKIQQGQEISQRMIAQAKKYSDAKEKFYDEGDPIGFYKWKQEEKAKTKSKAKSKSQKKKTAKSEKASKKRDIEQQVRELYKIALDKWERSHAAALQQLMRSGMSESDGKKEMTKWAKQNPRPKNPNTSKALKKKVMGFLAPALEASQSAKISRSEKAYKRSAEKARLAANNVNQAMGSNITARDVARSDSPEPEDPNDQAKWDALDELDQEFESARQPTVARYIPPVIPPVSKSIILGDMDEVKMKSGAGAKQSFGSEKLQAATKAREQDIKQQRDANRAALMQFARTDFEDDNQYVEFDGEDISSKPAPSIKAKDKMRRRVLLKDAPQNPSGAAVSATGMFKDLGSGIGGILDAVL